MFEQLMEKIYPEMAALREDLHRHPELSFQEHRTSALIIEKLKEYGVDSVERVCSTGVVALIRGSGEGKCIALRADIDALPVTEDSGVAFASENPGVMHACGHDLHTTNLLSVARLLCANRDKFKGCVKLLFQPAEEAANPSDPTGGAVRMCKAGVMENPHVDAIVALHVQPDLESTGFGLRKGVITSGFDLYRFDVHGKTSHGSQPHRGNDAILALSQFIVLSQQIVAKNIDPLKTAIVTIGTIQGGAAVNVVPAEATASACIRYYDNESAGVVHGKIMDIAHGVECVSGCRFDVDAKTGYSCVENDGALVELIETALTAELGEQGRHWMDEPASGSEDFSYYSLSTGTPGALMWLSAAPVMGDTVYPLHSAKCCLTSEILKTGAPGLAAICLRFLNA